MTLPLFFSVKTNGEYSEKLYSRTGDTFNNYLTSEKKGIYNFILKSVNYSEDANDIYQDTLLRAFRYFGKFDRSKKFRSWIFTIASNEIKRYFKGRTSLNNVQSIDQIYEQIPDCKDKKLAEAIYSIAFSLKTSDREIFFLFYDSGFLINEISEITGKKPGNIKVILSNARKKIRAVLRSEK